MIYKIVDENNLPQELLDAVEAGAAVYCESCIGWIKIDEPDFRCGLEYKVEINED